MSVGNKHRLNILPGRGSDSGWVQGRVEMGAAALVCLGHSDDPPTSLSFPEQDLVVAFSGRPRGPIPWGAEAWDRFTESMALLSEEQSSRLILRASAGHVLADAPACMGWLDRQRDEPNAVGVALTPASMLVPAQLANLEEHFDRMFHYLSARSRLIIIEDAVPDSRGTSMRGRLVGEGDLPGSLLGEMIDTFVDPKTPVLVHARDDSSARSWLWPDR